MKHLNKFNCIDSQIKKQMWNSPFLCLNVNLGMKKTTKMCDIMVQKPQLHKIQSHVQLS